MNMGAMEFSGLKGILKDFDERAWKGSFSGGDWRIASGGYDLWFEIYYRDQPVLQCVAGVLSSDYSGDASETEELLKVVLGTYDHLTIKKPTLDGRIRAAFAFAEETMSDGRQGMKAVCKRGGKQKQQSCNALLDGDDRC